MSDPVSVNDVLQEAIKLHNAGQVLEACALYRKAMQADRDNAEAVFLYGTAQRHLGNVITSLRCLKRACGMSDRWEFRNNFKNAAIDAVSQVKGLIVRREYEEASDVLLCIASVIPRSIEVEQLISLLYHRSFHGGGYFHRLIPRVSGRAEVGINSKIVHASASSILSTFRGKPILDVVRKEADGTVAFHSAVEPSPWLQIELDSVYPVSTIVVHNADDEKNCRSGLRSFSVYVSTNGIDYKKIHERELMFGGFYSDTALVVSCTDDAKFIRLEAEKDTTLRLDALEIRAFDFQEPPFGTGILGDDGVFYATCNSGYFSILFWILGTIILYCKSGVTIRGINLSGTFDSFKDDLDSDIYPDLFRFRGDLDHPAAVTKDGRELFPPQPHGPYKDYDFTTYRQLIGKYFSPSAAVEERVGHFLEKYRIDVFETVAICYRGTDKFLEATPVAYEKYASTARRIMAQDPSIRTVMIQTDDRNAREYFSRIFGNAGIFIEELPVVSSQTRPVAHFLPPGRRTEFSVNFLAAVLIVSRCKVVVNHTGNTACWIALYRGSADGLYQFDEDGELIEPGW